MKKIRLFSIALVTLMIVFGMGVVFAEPEPIMLIAPNPAANHGISVLLNDQMIDFTDENGNVVEPQIINSRTMVPMRKIFEVFGAEVEWNGELREVTAISKEKTLKLTIDQTEATVQEGEKEEKIVLDAAPTIIDGRTLVPVRFIAESLNLKVGWDPESRTVIILDTSFFIEKIEKNAPVFYELLTSSLNELENVETEEATVSATGNIKYINTNSKSSNTNLKLTIDGKIKENTEAIAADFTLKTTGKGSLLEQVKEAKLEKATMNMIVDKKTFVTYIKSNLLESSEVGKKWAVISLNQGDSGIHLGNMPQNADLSKMMDEMVTPSSLTTNTYYEIDEMLDLLCKLFSNDHLKVSGRTTRTYTYDITLDELLAIMGMEKSQLFADSELEINDLFASIRITTKVENNIATSSNITLSGTVNAGVETITFDLKADTKLTSKGKKVSINLPAEKDIVLIEK